MSSPLERIPGVAAVSDAIDRLLPVEDQHADFYHRLTGLWVLGGAYATEQTIEWAEKSMAQTDPVTFLGTVAVAALPTGAAAFMWRRGWQSQCK